MPVGQRSSADRSDRLGKQETCRNRGSWGIMKPFLKLPSFPEKWVKGCHAKVIVHIGHRELAVGDLQLSGCCRRALPPQPIRRLPAAWVSWHHNRTPRTDISARLRSRRSPAWRCCRFSPAAMPPIPPMWASTAPTSARRSITCSIRHRLTDRLAAAKSRCMPRRWSRWRSPRRTALTTANRGASGLPPPWLVRSSSSSPPRTCGNWTCTPVDGVLTGTRSTAI